MRLIAVTLRAKGKDIQPVRPRISLVVMVVFGSLCLAASACVRRDGRQPPLLHGTGYLGHCLNPVGVRCLVTGVKPFLQRLARRRLAIFAHLACLDCPASVAALIFSEASLAPRLQAIASAFVFVEFMGGLCFSTLATCASADLDVDSWTTCLLARIFKLAFFTAPLQAISLSAMLVKIAFWLSLAALATLFHHALQNRKAPTRFLQIVCLGQLASDWGASTKYNCNLSYPKQLHYSTIAPMAQGV